jgi:hypothetical protein
MAVLIVLGFVVGTAGHLYRSKTTIAAGIGLILLGSVGLPIWLYLSDR